MKFILIFGFLILSSCLDQSFGNNWEPCGSDWEQYKDEKCFKILEDDHPTQSFESAIEKCATIEDTSTLVTIESLEEQDFLSNFLFKIHKKVDNFWIGAKYSNNSFKWLDNSEMTFSNWDLNYPNERVDNNQSCVQMQANEVVAGKWTNEPCEKRNAVVCQKIQFWSIEQLQKSFIKARREFNDSQNDLRKTKIELKQTKFELNETANKIEIIRNNSVPIGFLYIQLSNQPEPKTLWPTVEWKDVTSEYAGLFFRAEGNGSTEFGFVQEENAPRITHVSIAKHPQPQTGVGWSQTTLNVGKQSSGMGVFSGFDSWNAYGYTHNYFQSGGEVRPRNMSIRFWKRTE